MTVRFHIHILRDPTSTHLQGLYLQVVVVIVAVGLSVIMRSVDTLGRVARDLEPLVEARVWKSLVDHP